ncbi:MAG: DUF4097 domain-containing protein [Treponema sp.]|nr:DUF4097 domain-containing protein [Treponema sp.]
MRKTSVILFCFLLLPFFVFSQEASDFDQNNQQLNIVLKEDYKVAQISSLKIDCIGEDLKFYIFYGDEITVEVSSNNLKFQPEIQLSESILTITDKYNPRKGDLSTVSIYLPYDFIAESFDIYSKYGKISVQNLNAQESILISSDSGKIQGRDIACDYLEVHSKNGAIKFLNTQCSYFDFRTTSAPITLSLLSAPLARSLCESQSGKIEFEIPQHEPFTLKIFSASGSFRNHQNDTISNPNPAVIYKNDEKIDTAVVEISTRNGNIVLK